MKVELQLVAGEVSFEPRLSGTGSLQAALEGWVQAFLDAGNLVARLDSVPGICPASDFPQKRL